MGADIRPAGMIFMILFFCAGLAQARTEKKSTCPVFRDFKIRTALDLDDVRHDYTMTARELTRMSREQYAGILGAGIGAEYRTVSGLRVSRVKASGSMTWDRAYDTTGYKICQAPRDIKIIISLSPKIFIARENLSGACGKETLAHEMSHVDVDNRLAQGLAVALERKIGDYLRKNPASGAMTSKQSDATRDTVNDAIQGIIDAEYKRAAVHAQRLQAIIDTPAEYARIQSICNGQTVP